MPERSIEELADALILAQDIQIRRLKEVIATLNAIVDNQDKMIENLERQLSLKE